MVTQSCKYGLLYGDKNNKQEEHGILVSFIGRHTNFYSCINLLHLCVKKIKVLIFYLFPYIYIQAIISGLLSTLLIAWANFSNEHFLCHHSVLISLLQGRTGLSKSACILVRGRNHTVWQAYKGGSGHPLIYQTQFFWKPILSGTMLSTGENWMKKTQSPSINIVVKVQSNTVESSILPLSFYSLPLIAQCPWTHW